MNWCKPQSPLISRVFSSKKFFELFCYLVMCSCLAIATGPQTLPAQDCTSQPVTTGYRDFNFGSSVHYQPTAEKSESKLWWNDGFWWGSLWNSASSRYRIHRFNLASQCWQDVGPDLDNRTKSLADALWDGTHLYIASHIVKSNTGPARLYRYSYSSAAKTYSLDTGFPVEVNSESSETLTLAKDSRGQLWVTWMADNNIMINRSTSNDQTWGTPFVLPVQDSQVHPDDISAIISFGGDKIGVMWSNQVDRKNYFAVHLDSNADQTWEPREVALADAGSGAASDDHINLKIMPDGGGNVYAVTKTGFTGSSSPLIYALKRAANGQWTKYVFGNVHDNHTRPILMIDEENRKLYIFAMSYQSTPHLIYMKSANLDNISFASGLGSVFLQSATDQNINNPTSTKQNVNGTTDLVVLASDEDSNYYLHNYINLSSGSSNNSPVANNDAATTARDTPVEIPVTANDTDSDGSINVTTVTITASPSSGATSVNTVTGVVTYTPNAGFEGNDTFTYTVRDNQGAVSNVALVSVTVSGAPPTDFSFNPSEDAQVYSSNPSTNYGANTTFRLRSPDYNSYLKFNVTGLSGQVQSAKLRLYVTDASPNGGSLYLVSNNYQSGGSPWVEEGLTWNTAPVISGSPLSQAGTVSLNTWVELDVTSAIAGNGIYSFGINSSSTNSAIYSSKEGANSPQLVIETVGSGGNTSPVANNDAASTSENTAVAINVLTNDTDSDGSIDPATVAVATSPGNGTITAINSTTGAITYTPNASFVGTDNFTYTVQDDIGAVSNAATVTITVNSSGGTETLTFNPVEDAYVYSSSPSKNYGANTILRLRSPDYNSYLKFNVTGLSGQVQSAKLRLYVTDASPNGGSLYLVSNNYQSGGSPWSEEGLTWNTAPVISGTPLSQTGAVSLNTWVELDVTSAITGNGIHSFGINSSSTNSAIYSSKEGSQPPQLVIETASGALAENTDDFMRPAAPGLNLLLPDRFELSPNYPNPFNAQTIIKYALPERAAVRLVIYDAYGHEVLKLIDEIQPAGYQHVLWNGRNRYGQEVASGMYLYRLEVGGQRFNRHMTLLK